MCIFFLCFAGLFLQNYFNRIDLKYTVMTVSEVYNLGTPITRKLTTLLGRKIVSGIQVLTGVLKYEPSWLLYHTSYRLTYLCMF